MVYVDTNQIEREGYIARHYLGDRDVGKAADQNNAKYLKEETLK